MSPRPSHRIEYNIVGGAMQLVEIILDPGEAVVAEAGAMLFMEQGIRMDSILGDGSAATEGIMGKLWNAGKRALTGESMFITRFTNHATNVKQSVGFSAPYPGCIVPINLALHQGSILCQKEAFLCAALGTEISLAFNKRLGAGLFGGEGFIMEELKGDGFAFIHAGGTIVERKLAPGEKLQVDTGCLVAFERGMDFDIRMVRGIKSMMFSGEGVFLAQLTGPGTVWIQSLPFSSLAHLVVEEYLSQTQPQGK